MDGYKSRDPELGIVMDSVKMTVKGGIGKLQEKARGGGWKARTALARSRPADLAARHPG